MYMAAFIIITAMHGEQTLNDPDGPSPTLEACEQRIAESQASMEAHLRQFGLIAMEGKCFPEESV